MEIQREVYLKRLVASRHNGLIKVVTRIRRSGKSYLLVPLAQIRIELIYVTVQITNIYMLRGYCLAHQPHFLRHSLQRF